MPQLLFKPEQTDHDRHTMKTLLFLIALAGFAFLSSCEAPPEYIEPPTPPADS